MSHRRKQQLNCLAGHLHLWLLLPLLLLQLKCAAQLQNADHMGGVSVRLALQNQQQQHLLQQKKTKQEQEEKPQQPLTEQPLTEQPPKPGQKQLRRGKLAKLLGSQAQEDLRLGWLSIRARNVDPGAVEMQPEQQRLLNRQLAAVNASQPFVRGWLVRLAACPGRASWTDLGEDFWPRWARNVYCDGDGDSGDGGAFCGWPAGLLRCGAQRKQRPRRLQLLRWRCQAGGLEARLRRLRLRRQRKRRHRGDKAKANSQKTRKRWTRRLRSIADRLSLVTGNFKCRWAPDEVSVVSEICVCGGSGVRE